MVHLSSIPQQSEKDKEIDNHKNSKARLDLSDLADEFTTSVYGSKFAGQDLPKTHMPEGQMPKEVAYRMIKDELSLDNNPMLKCVFHPPSNFTPVVQVLKHAPQL